MNLAASTDGAIAELDRIFAAQRAAQHEAPYPALEVRLDRLLALEELLRASRAAFASAVRDDFGAHPEIVTDIYETGAVLGRSRHFRRELAGWLEPRPVALHPRAHGSSTAEAVAVPRGVVGCIAPWNFPIECALVMAVDMLAAGNRIILKPSPLAPACAEAIRAAVSDAFDERVFAVALGGDDLAERFARLPWDHLTFTGSAATARRVMRAAAENLTPLTLELGGKNPAVFAADGVDDELIRRFLESRILKGGQVCTSPDHVLVPASLRDEWIARASRLWREMYPSYVDHPDATSAISRAHFDRVLGYVAEARAHGVEVVSLNGDEPDADRRVIPLYVLVDPPPQLASRQEEIFGPVSPVCSYGTIDEAIEGINAGPAPLASYIATRDEALADRFVRQVRSGGSAVNNFGTQAGHPAIPFGGLGQSGFGCHSGHEGFLQYSHVKGVYRGASDSAIASALALPYGTAAAGLADSLFR